MAFVAEIDQARTQALQRAPSLGGLTDLVESQVIPRLMVAHGARPPVSGVDDVHSTVISRDEVAAFAPLTLGLEAHLLLTHVEALIARGVPIDTLLVELLAPAARQLGEWWEEDRCDFIEVTMGLWRLQEVARELAANGPPRGRDAAGWSRRALFAAMPGDQHSFGTVLIDEIFRRHGWDSQALLDATASELLAAVGRERLDVIGLTVSCDCHIARLPSLVTALRSISRNPRVRVMVGGRVFAERPGLAAVVGADGTASDARGALILAEGMIDAPMCGSAVGR